MTMAGPPIVTMRIFVRPFARSSSVILLSSPPGRVSPEAPPPPSPRPARAMEGEHRRRARERTKVDNHAGDEPARRIFDQVLTGSRGEPQESEHEHEDQGGEREGDHRCPLHRLEEC